MYEKKICFKNLDFVLEMIKGPRLLGVNEAVNPNPKILKTLNPDSKEYNTKYKVLVK